MKYLTTLLLTAFLSSFTMPYKMVSVTNLPGKEVSRFNEFFAEQKLLSKEIKKATVQRDKTNNTSRIRVIVN